MDIKGITAVVTGAGSGIGAATAELLARSGAEVVVVDVDADAAGATAGRIGGRAVAGDVSDPATWDRIIEAAPGVRLAHLNAGVYGHAGPIDELPLDTYRRVVAANLDGVVLGTRAMVGAMRRTGGGAIVATASMAGLFPFAGNPVYTATKHAVVGFVRALAPSLEPAGIRIGAVCPGVVDTPMVAQAADLHDISRAMPLIAPAEVAAAVVDVATSGPTGRCVAVLPGREPVDWTFTDLTNLAV